MEKDPKQHADQDVPSDVVNEEGKSGQNENRLSSFDLEKFFPCKSLIVGNLQRFGIFIPVQALFVHIKFCILYLTDGDEGNTYNTFMVNLIIMV